MSLKNLHDQLIQTGWALKMESFPENKQRMDEIKRFLLDNDIRIYGEKSLPDLAKLEQTTKPYVVQLHKTRNITAPKDNESSSHRPHLYRLVITDGHVFQNALVLPSLRNFNFDTPPGVKILLKPQTKVCNGFYLLNDQTCEVLGGTVNELVQKWKLARLMGKHVRTLIGEGAPPPWVPFGTRNSNATTVDTSQRSMDVAKMQQSNEEDPEFVRLRRAAIETLITDQISKTQRFARQDAMRAANVAKGFEQASRRGFTDRPNTAKENMMTKRDNYPNSASASSTSTKSATTTNTRLPEWAKNQIADEPVREERRRGGRGRDQDEETRPSKDVTLFDFFDTKTNSAKPKNQSIPSATQKPTFPFQNGDQVLARYHEDNEYYPAIIMNVVYDTKKCVVMFEGYDTRETVNFHDVEPYEEGYYEEEYPSYEHRPNSARFYS